MVTKSSLWTRTPLSIKMFPIISLPRGNPSEQVSCVFYDNARGRIFYFCHVVKRWKPFRALELAAIVVYRRPLRER